MFNFFKQLTWEKKERKKQTNKQRNEEKESTKMTTDTNKHFKRNIFNQIRELNRLNSSCFTQ